MELCAMSDSQVISGGSGSDPIDFSRHLIGSQGFSALFEDSMTLVEETAAYLDGPGRVDARTLTQAGRVAYAAESMRLTTRLMQLASWLLLQRAVNKGEMTPEQAAVEKAKVKLNGLSSAMHGPGWDDLPTPLRNLIERSTALHTRIRRLDKAIGGDRAVRSASENPVRNQLGRIVEAFAAQ
jgi:regulator of CtrA degradation